MVKSDRNAHDRNDQTYWEEVATTRWGIYKTNMERQAILCAHKLSSSPNTAIEFSSY